MKGLKGESKTGKEGKTDNESGREIVCVRKRERIRERERKGIERMREKKKENRKNEREREKGSKINERTINERERESSM